MINFRDAMNRIVRLRNSLGAGVILAAVPAFTIIAHAAPSAVDPTAVLTIFDQGGVLDPAGNGGYVLGSIEVDPVSGEVYLLAGDTPFFQRTNSLILIRSTGMQTASTVGAPYPIQVVPWAYDLTIGPNDLLYVAGAIADVGGIFGLDPAGIAPLSLYATDTCTWGTTGLSFSADGTRALVSTDGSEVTCRNGLYEVHPDNSYLQLIERSALPDGIPRGVDDHAVTQDGRIILAGDKSHELWDVTDGAGSVSELIDLDDRFTDDEVPGWNPAVEVFGSRIAVDPATGILYYTHGLGQPGSSMTIFAVTPDGAGARIVAEGFYILRDIAFGPGSSGTGRSLYLAVLERDSALPDHGLVYELALAPDDDSDGLANTIDNCSTVANPDQRDTDGDAIGNLCDPDLNNDCAVNFADLNLMKAVFFGSDADADLNGDGSVNFADLNLVKEFFFGAPGPSGLATCD